MYGNVTAWSCGLTSFPWRDVNMCEVDREPLGSDPSCKRQICSVIPSTHFITLRGIRAHSNAHTCFEMRLSKTTTVYFAISRNRWSNVCAAITVCAELGILCHYACLPACDSSHTERSQYIKLMPWRCYRQNGVTQKSALKTWMSLGELILEKVLLSSTSLCPYNSISIPRWRRAR